MGDTGKECTMTTDLKSMTQKQLEKLRTDIDKALLKLTGSEKKAARAAAEKAGSRIGSKR